MSALAIDEKGRQLHKFGGSSLADAKCYLRVANIMANYSEPDDLMVVSAAGSTTNQLINWVKLSQSDRAAAEQAQQTLQRYQTALISDLLPEIQASVLIFQFNDDIHRLAELLKHPLNDVIYAEVVGHGEIWSARLMAQVLQEQGMAAQWLDARTFLCAERAAQPEVDTARSQPLLAELLALHPGKRLVVTGFISRNRAGETVLLGRNGSDYSATQVGALAGVKNQESRHTLLATGAAAGLTAAFNAPLAGILFIIEEMRPQFRYSLISIKAVFIGVIMSSIVFQTFNSGAPILDIGKYHAAPLNTLWLYLVLGMVFGVIGVMFNRFLLTMQTQFRRFYQDKTSRFVATGGLIGGLCGIAGLYWPQVTGGGFAVIPDVAALHYSLTGILMIFLFRVLTTVICFSSGAPGGIFAPTLALGTLFGSFFGYAAMLLFPQYQIEPATFAIAGMGALFAATVRAPLTGIVLVLEMTDNYQLILPMIITCLGATLLAQYLGGRPLYSVLLERILMQNGTPPEKTGDAPRG